MKLITIIIQTKEFRIPARN